MKITAKQRQLIVRTVAALVAALIAGTGYLMFADRGTPEGAFVVERVVDGDTIVVRDQAFFNPETYTIRLIGVNTPETVDPRRAVECFGEEASAFLKRELPADTAVYLDADPDKPNTDTFDRLLRYVIRANDSVVVNKLVIEEGYGHEADYNEPYAFKNEFVAAQKSASDAKRGLWADDACVK